MYISHVTLENIRGFHGARNVDLDLTRPDGSHAGWTVIAGRNGSGKTTLLRAIALVMCGQAAARTLVADFGTWVSMNHDEALAELLLTPSAYRETLIPRAHADTRPFLSGLRWVSKVYDDHRVIFGQVAYEERDVLGLQQPDFEAWDGDRTDWLCAGYGPFRRLVGGSGDTQRLMTSPGPISRLASLFHEDASLAEGVSWLIDQHLRSLEHREGAQQLKDAALRILADGLLPDGYQVENVDSDGLWVTNDGTRFPLREMSDGYRTVAALVVDLIKQIHRAYGTVRLESVDGRPAIIAPGVVIIDEVDAHLHVSWQKRIGGWLKEHFPQIQFIVTSHSPYICQAADPNGLIRLPGPDEDMPPQVVGPDLYQRIVYGSGDDATLSELFGLDTPYSERAEALRGELIRLEGIVLAGSATPRQITRYRELTALLTSSPAARVDEVAARLGSTEATEE